MREHIESAFAYLLGGVLILVGSAVVAGAVAFNAGAIRIYVLEKKPGGDHVNLLVPAALVPLALKFIPDHKRQRALAQLDQWLPALQTASRELARVEDATFVEVQGPKERVRVSKLGGSLVVDVQSDRETVYVSFPLRLVDQVAEELHHPGLLP